jgi:beta-lactamase regulating signal transducer with metallopeptidase domain
MMLLEVLLEITVYSWILFGGIMLLRQIIKKCSSPSLQYLVWLIFIARLCIPITLDSGVHLFVIPEPHIPAEQSVHITESNPMFTHNSSNIPMKAVPVFGQVQGDQANKKHEPMSNRQSVILSDNTIAPTTLAPSTFKVDWYHAAMGIWIAGIASILSFFIATSIKINERIKSSTIVSSEKLIAMVENCRKDLHIKKPIATYVIEDIMTPALTVSFNPKLLLPADMIGEMEDEQVLFAIRHELTHFKRRDHLVSLLLRILEAVYWFNPIIWIASKKILMDMEMACDNQVVKAMEKPEKKYYANTILEMFSQDKGPQFVLGMAMVGTRGMAEKRIRGIYMNSRTKPKVKFLIIALVAALIFSCFTTACQPTPEEPVVIGKGDGELEKIIQSQPETQDPQAQQPDIIRYTDSFKGADENVTINIDAHVLMPSGNMPVIEVKSYTIPMEQVKAMAKVLFHGNTAYEPKVGLSKADLEEEILKLKQFISNEDAMLEYYGGEQRIVDEVKAEFKQRIAQYEKQYEDAPDTIEIRETDWVFRPKAYYTDMVLYDDLLGKEDEESVEIEKSLYDSETIRLDSKVEDYKARLTVSNLETGRNIEHYAIFTIGSDLNAVNTPIWNEGDTSPMNMTREEAVGMVYDALAKMGITNMQLSDCRASGKFQLSAILSESGLTEEEANLAAAAGEVREPEKGDADERSEDVYSYHMDFTPVYGDIVVHNMAYAYIDKVQYGPRYPYEELRVTVQNGIITDLYWYAPMEQVRVENENVPILSLDEAVQTFKKQMQLEYTIGKLARYSPENEDYEEYISCIESGEINITDIRLGLMRVHIKDRPGEYRMVPAWMFLGSERLYAKGIDPEMQMYAPDKPFPYIIINAIDGSIINVSQGY